LARHFKTLAANLLRAFLFGLSELPAAGFGFRSSASSEIPSEVAHNS
jgi:hypothetical protein